MKSMQRRPKHIRGPRVVIVIRDAQGQITMASSKRTRDLELVQFGFEKRPKYR